VDVKRPIELTIGLVVLLIEYLAVMPQYLVSFFRMISANGEGKITAILVWSFVAFVAIRPIILYLLWRGTSWVRTWVIWIIPVSFVLSLFERLRKGATGGADNPSQATQAINHLSGQNHVTQVALLIGFLALLVLYSPRVSAWFKFEKERRAQRSNGNV
jgi:hypothetical protein